MRLRYNGGNRPPIAHALSLNEVFSTGIGFCFIALFDNRVPCESPNNPDYYHSYMFFPKLDDEDPMLKTTPT